METKELLYSLRQVRYWANRASHLAESSDASDEEKEGNKEKEKSPCTPLKEKETKGEKELSLLRARARAFVPPTVEEVAAYCRERNNAVNAEQFVAFYESKGWKVGRSPMKNWKASVITWEKRASQETPIHFVRSVRHADNWRGTRKEEIGDVLG